MKRHIQFPSIEQYRNVVFDVKHRATYTGKDVDGNATYDDTIIKPILTFTGTVKLHGTNASVAYTESAGLWVQSKETIITPESDNAGFARFANENKDAFIELCKLVADKNNISLDDNAVAIYGEWAGMGIQKGVGINQIPKSFFIIGVKISPNDNQNESETVVDGVKSNAYWVAFDYLRDTEKRIFNILDFKTYSVTIDFNNPEAAQTALTDMMLEVETECPVAASFDVVGTGEGIVWSTVYDDHHYRFKVKGEKHKISKTKEAVPVDIEKMNSINEFINYSVTEARFNQAIEKVFNGNKSEMDIKRMGDFIKWIVNDIIKEESDVMEGNGLEPKEVTKFISNKSREMFMKALSL